MSPTSRQRTIGTAAASPVLYRASRKEADCKLKHFTPCGLIAAGVTTNISLVPALRARRTGEQFPVILGAA